MNSKLLILCGLNCLGLLIPSISQANCQYSFRADFLYWEATEDGLEYAVKFEPTPQGFPAKQTWYEPTTAWKPGVRLELSRQMECTCWDVSLGWTHLNSHTTHHTSQSGSDFLEQLWTPPEFGINPLKASAHWHLNFNTFDLLLGQMQSITCNFSMNPFLGLRGSWIDQNFHTMYKGGDFDVDDPIKFHALNRFGGIGIHLGTGLDFLFNEQWSLVGEGAYTLYYSRISVHEKVGGRIVAIDFSSSNLFQENRSFDRVSSDVSAALGIKWEPSFCNWNCRLSIALMYELIYLFDQNHMRKYRNIEPADPLWDNLGLQGGTLSITLKI